MADIFISYSRGTHEAAGAIAQALMLEGYEVWWDHELPVHRAYTDVIQEQLDAAKAVVVVWSADAARSEWVRSEANFGRERSKLVQVLAEDAALPLPFSQIQFADLRGWRGERGDPEWRKVVASLSHLVAQPAPRTGAAARAIHAQFAPARPRASPIGFIALGVAAVLLVLAGLLLLRVGEDQATLVQRLQTLASVSPREASGVAGTPEPQRLSEAPGPAVASAPPGGFFFPDSDRRLLGPGDVAPLSKAQLRIARNEIYARHGRTFARPDLRRYFERMPWYHPIGTDVSLNPTEQANVQFLQAAEAGG